MMKKLLSLVALSFSLATGFAATQNVTHEFSTNPEVASDVIIVKNPVVIAEPVNQTATEVYMVLDNTGKQAHQVVAATSTSAQMVQLHDMYMKNGQMFMHQVPNIPIKADSDEAVEGSFHVMLIDTHKQLTSGQIVPITLIFEDGSWIALNATVK